MEPPGNPFEMRYRPLLNIEQNTAAATIFPLLNDTTLFSRYLSSSPTSVVERGILEWIENLDDDQNSVNQSPPKTRQLKDVANRIIVADNIALLVAILKRDKLFNDNVSRRIDWLGRKIVAIHIMPLPAFPGAGLPRISHLVCMHFRSHHGSQKTLPSASTLQADQRELIEQLCDSGAEEVKETLLALVRSNRGLDSFTTLLSDFEEDRRVYILNQLESWLHPDELIHLMMDLDFQKVQPWIASLGEGQARLLNAALKRADEIIIDNFKAALPRLLQSFLDINNEQIKPAIDALAADFRRTPILNITTSDIKKIEALAQAINFQKIAIDRFVILIDGIITETVNLHAFGDLKMEYSRFEKRLDPACKDHEPGSLYQILYDLAFEQFEDGDEAYEVMTGVWHMNDPNNFVKSKLIAKLPDKEVNPWPIISDELKALELTTVADLKRNKIFNRTLLKQFIVQAHTQPPISAAAAAAGEI